MNQDPRKPIADAIKAAGGNFNRDGAVEKFDALMDFMGVARAFAPVLQPSRKALDLIKSFEGYAKALPDGGCEAYPDPGTGGAPWTIGWGSTGPDIKKGTRWTRQQAEARFREHVEEFSAGVRRLIGDSATTQGEFDALVSFAYNVGLGALGSSTLLKLHKAGDKAGAAKQFARWNKAAGRVLNGLTRRRAAEAALYGGVA